jgi:hypothetical protein
MLPAVGLDQFHQIPNLHLAHCIGLRPELRSEASLRTANQLSRFKGDLGNNKSRTTRLPEVIRREAESRDGK